MRFVTVQMVANFILHIVYWSSQSPVGNSQSAQSVVMTELDPLCALVWDLKIISVD